MMKISDYFANRLNAPLANHVWSWGSHNPTTNQVFLRNGKWSIDEYGDGKQWMTVYNPEWRSSAGHAERLRHLEMIKAGAEGLVVLVDFDEAGHIAAFDDHALVRIGNITEEGGLVYAEVFGELSIDDALMDRQARAAIDDIAKIPRSVAKTTRVSLIAARLGQGAFRAGVLRNWHYCCAVTRVGVSVAIRASHIKPWRSASNPERLDPCNGLPLVATLDCLFDNGYITFDRRRNMLLSSMISEPERRRLLLDGLRLQKSPPKETASYLQYHREHVFRP